MQNLRRKYPQAIKKQDVDAIIHVRQAEKHLQDMKRASCRYIDLKKSICNSEYQGSVDTSAAKRVSATEHIKVLQIHQLPKEHLRQQINTGYRYIRFQKSKSPHCSIYFNYDTPKSKKKTMQSGELEAGLPDEAEQESIVFFLALRLS